MTASVFSRAVGGEGKVCAVDVTDLRVVHEGFQFNLTEGARLPFADDSFDVVVSNHVLEHVGLGVNPTEQLEHLREVGRVLTKDGHGYLATPNRWAPIEPHFSVPFLTWIPARWRTPYLAKTGKARVYDCRPLSSRELKASFEAAGLTAEEQTYEAMKLVARMERPWIGTRLALRAPQSLLKALHPIIPTYVFKLRPKASI